MPLHCPRVGAGCWATAAAVHTQAANSRQRQQQPQHVSLHALCGASTLHEHARLPVACVCRSRQCTPSWRPTRPPSASPSWAQPPASHTEWCVGAWTHAAAWALQQRQQERARQLWRLRSKRASSAAQCALLVLAPATCVAIQPPPTAAATAAAPAAAAAAADRHRLACTS